MTEEQPYDVLGSYPGFELRSYPAYVLAQVTVNAGFSGAGNSAFRHLFGYISGNNLSQSGEDAAAGPERIAMTAPVVMEPSALPGAYTVGFVLPAEMDEQAAPSPQDQAVSIVTVPGGMAAAAEYSGRWSERNFVGHLEGLRTAIAAQGLTEVGNPRFARFDPPYRPTFLRRNEVILDVRWGVDNEE